MVQQQQRSRGVALQTAGRDVRFEVQYDPFVAEADAEVLKAPVPASGLRQDVVELVAEHGGGVTGRGPQRGFAASGVMVLVEHPPAVRSRRSVARRPRQRVPLEVVLLAVDRAAAVRAVVAVLLADEHLDLGGKSQEAAVEVAA